MVNVALDHVGVRQPPHILVCRFHRCAEVHRNQLAGAIPGRVVSVPPVAAAGVEHHLVAKELRLDGMDPVEELGFVLVVQLGELLPLPAESSRRLLLLTGNGWRHEPRHAAPYRERRLTPYTVQATAQDLFTTTRIGFRRGYP